MFRERKHIMKPSWVKKSAKEAIDKLLSLAEADEKKSKRYTDLAKKKSRKYKIPLGKTKRKICKKCSALLIPGKNLRVRKAPKPKSGLIQTCLECGNKIRIPTGEKLKKRKTPKR